jgi:hypothetical protein
MSREMKAISFSILGAGLAALLGFLSLNLIVWSCGESNTTEPECVTVEGCPEGGICQAAVCRGGKCAIDDAPDFSECNQGLCLDGTCRDDICLISAAASRLALAGELDATNGCSICDPDRSRDAWSAYVCVTGASDCRSSPTCNNQLEGGQCQGEDCCLGDPVWSGTGTPPTCTFPGGGQGTCTVEGECGGCQNDAECDDGRECVVFHCNAVSVCESHFADNGSDCQFGSDAGRCLGGQCYKACVNSASCSANQYCDDQGMCLGKLAAGSACTEAEECVSNYCELAFDSDSVDRRCTASACTVCERSTNRGTCDPLPDGPIEGCTGTCGGSGPYPDDGNWKCCAGECSCIEIGSDCP